MIADVGRRFFLFAGTPRGKRINLTVTFGVGAVMQVTATILVATGHNNRGAATLSSLAAGLLIAGVFFILMNRRPT
jgi:hypothetical protein